MKNEIDHQTHDFRDEDIPVVCGLLMSLSRTDLTKVIELQEVHILKKIFSAALSNQDFEICQAIKEVLGKPDYPLRTE
jgi:hypothetical protein